MSTSITVVCYKSKTLSNGEHPLMLRICQDRKTKYQSLGVSIAEKHWDFEKNSPKSKCPNRDILIKLILKVLEKPRDFDPFGHAGLSPLVTI